MNQKLKHFSCKYGVLFVACCWPVLDGFDQHFHVTDIDEPQQEYNFFI